MTRYNLGKEPSGWCFLLKRFGTCIFFLRHSGNIYQFLLKFVEASNLTVPVFLVLHPNLPIPNLCGLLSVNMHCLAPANVSRLIAESTFLLMIVVLNPSLRGSKAYFFLSFQGTFSSMGNIHGTRNMTWKHGRSSISKVTLPKETWPHSVFWRWFGVLVFKKIVI